MSEKKTQIGTRPGRSSKEYNDRWVKPLVNKPTTMTQDEIEELRRKQEKGIPVKDWLRDGKFISKK